MHRASGRSRRATRLIGALALTGCNWISLGANAATYETLAAGEAGNLVVADSLAYVTLADSGIAVLDARTARRVALVPPPAGLQSVDDIAIADGLLFLLDAREPGAVAAVRMSDPLRPSPSQSVPVGPFSGISAAGGVAVVSGGTSRLTLWHYDSSGALTLADSMDLGRGQPDVSIDPRGRRAYVSTHYRGPYFGLNVLELTPTLRATTRIELDGAGFTAGGAKPAHFPIDAAHLNDSTVLVAHALGIAVVNVARGTLDQLIDAGGPAVSVDVKESEAAVAVAGRAPGVVVLDFGAPSPRLVRRVTFAPGTKPIAVALSVGNVLVAARDRGVLVVQR